MKPATAGKTSRKTTDSALSNRKNRAAGRMKLTLYFAISYGKKPAFLFTV